jgi:outer membrane protein assembly factor BamB
VFACSAVKSKDGRIYAIETNHGTTQWQSDIDSSEDYANGAFVLGHDTVIGGDGNLTSAVDRRTGDERWSYSNSVHGLAVDRKNVYISGPGVVALDINMGTVQWQFDPDINTGPVVTDESSVYTVTGDNCLYSLDSRTATVEWQFEMSGILSSSAPLVVSGGTVYYQTNNPNILYAVDCASGTSRWQIGRDGWPSTMEVQGGTVFIGGNSGRLDAFNTETGDLRWYFDFESSIHSLSVGTENLYVGTGVKNDHTLYTIEIPHDNSQRDTVIYTEQDNNSYKETKVNGILDETNVYKHNAKSELEPPACPNCETVISEHTEASYCPNCGQEL